ncbi:MAG: hypothetical protein AAF571_04230 [Verrucomicrobiota bacterium]
MLPYIKFNSFNSGVFCFIVTIGWLHLSSPQILAGTDALARLEAVSAMALNHAEKYRSSGDDAVAQALTEQAGRLSNTVTGRLGDIPVNILPEVPEWNGNPYVAGTLEYIERMLAKPDTEFLLGEKGAQQFIKGKADPYLNSRNTADEMRVYAWAGLHPQSPYRGNPEVLVRALRRAHAFTDAYVRTDITSKDMTINDFFACYSMMDGLLMLKHGCSDLVLPVQMERWDAAVRKAGAFWFDFIQEYNGVGWWTDDASRGFGSFCNHNVTEGMIVQFAWLYHQENREYQDVGKRVVAMQKKALYPDGAISYIRDQNQCYGYHAVNIVKFIRHWELTGDPIAMELLTGTRNFYPLTTELGNTNEWWSAPVWKYQWNSSGYGPAQEIVAGLTGCGYNKAIANQELDYHNGRILSIEAAPYFRSAVKPVDRLENFMVFDRNIQGARSRNGRFGTALVGRNYGNEDSGKMAFAGCIVADPIDNKRHPLNAAVMAVYPRVRIRDDVEEWRGCAYLSHNEQNSMTVGHTFGGLATTHDLAMTSFGQVVLPQEWGASQQWISLPGRIIGMVEVYPKSKDLRAYDITGRVRLGYGRSGPLRPKEITRLDDQHYAYGDLQVRLHQHNYAGISTEISGIFRDSARKATEIVFSEPAHESTGKRVYSEDTRYYFTVEIMPEWSQPADSFMVIDENNIRGFETQVGDKRFLLIHNISDEEVSYRANLDQWDRGRRAALFTGNDGQPVRPEILTLRSRMSLTVPASSHVVLVFSADSEDLTAGLYDFGKLLETTNTLFGGTQ